MGSINLLTRIIIEVIIRVRYLFIGELLFSFFECNLEV